jgi:hypothetical protein
MMLGGASTFLETELEKLRAAVSPVMREASCCRLIGGIGMIDVELASPLMAGRADLAMATGMFRTGDGWVRVDYDGNNIPIPRSKYEENGYKPAFDKLPLEEDYWAAQEKVKSSEAKNTISVIK